MKTEEIKEKLIGYNNQLEKEKDNKFSGRTKFIKAGRIIDQQNKSTKTFLSTYCRSCGKFVEDAGSTTSSYRWAAPALRIGNECTCGESSNIATDRSSGYAFWATEHSVFGVLEVNEKEGYVVFFNVSGSLRALAPAAASEEESLKKAELKFEYLSYSNPLEVGFFDFKKPFVWCLRYYAGKHSIRRDGFPSTALLFEDELMDKFIDAIKAIKPSVNKMNLMETLNKILSDNASAIRSTPAKKTKATLKKQEFQDAAADYSPADSSLISRRVRKAFYKKCCPPMRLITNIAGYSTYECFCKKCGERFEYKVESSNAREGMLVDYSCPSCGEEAKYDIKSEAYRIENYQNGETYRYDYVDELNAIMIRKFSCVVQYPDTTPGTPYEISVNESSRAFLGEKFSVFLCQGSHKKWAPVSSDVFTYSRFYSDTFFPSNTEEELIECFNASPLKYSGALDAWGLASGGKFKMEDPGRFSSSSYLYLWLSKKYVELLLKTGLTTAIKEIAGCKKTEKLLAKKSAKDVCTLLGVTKPVFKIAQELNPKIEEINMIQKLWDVDNTMTAQDYKDISEFKKESVVVDIKGKYNIPFAKQLAYIKDCYDYQCIDQTEAFQLWYDYLNIAASIGYNIKNRNVKYPISLKKEHDIAAFAANKMQKGFNDKEFASRAKENSRFNYSLKSLKLFVEAPTEPQQVINEGVVLHHCVTNYVNAIIEGRSIVMFIRQENAPEDPFFTAEILIKGGTPTITQVKGNMNSDPDTSTAEGKKIMEFVKKWAAFKGLNLSL